MSTSRQFKLFLREMIESKSKKGQHKRRFEASAANCGDVVARLHIK